MGKFFKLLLIFFFTCQASYATWYNASWTYRIPITVEAGQVDADLTDFPIYLDLSDFDGTGLFANALSNGADLRITKSDGTTEVPVEIVTYDAGVINGGELHFKASGTLSSTVNGTFYLYYGNSGASLPAASATYGSENVWSSNYLYVSHCEGNTNDSTSNSNDGTETGIILGVTGQLSGNGRSFSANAYSDLGTSSTLRNANNYTATAWVKGGLVASQSALLSHYNASASRRSWAITAESDEDMRAIVSQSGTSSAWKIYDSTTTILDNSWHYVAFTFSANDLNFYDNGSAITPTLTADGTVNTLYANTVDSVMINSFESAPSASNAVSYDEVRLLGATLTSTWLSTEYNNQSSPSTFYSVGTQEANPGPGGAEANVIFFGTVF